MNKKNLISIIILNLIVMLLTIGFIIFRYRSISEIETINTTLSNKIQQNQKTLSRQTTDFSQVPSTTATIEKNTIPEENTNKDIQTKNMSKRNIGFQYRNSHANNVEIIGDFTNWTPKPMIKGEDYKWTIALALDPGEYAYNYVVNGKPVRDPNNLKVCDVGRGFPNSYLRVKPLINDDKEKSK